MTDKEKFTQEYLQHRCDTTIKDIQNLVKDLKTENDRLVCEIQYLKQRAENYHEQTLNLQ